MTRKLGVEEFKMHSFENLGPHHKNCTLQKKPSRKCAFVSESLLLLEGFVSGQKGAKGMEVSLGACLAGLGQGVRALNAFSVGNVSARLAREPCAVGPSKVAAPVVKMARLLSMMVHLASAAD